MGQSEEHLVIIFGIFVVRHMLVELSDDHNS